MGGWQLYGEKAGTQQQRQNMQCIRYMYRLQFQCWVVLPMIHRHRQTPQANPTGIPLIQTMYQMFFPSEYGNTSSSSTGSSKCKRFNRYSSRIHKQETAQLPSSATSCLSTIRDNLAPTTPQFKMHRWTQLMSKLIWIAQLMISR